MSGFEDRDVTVEMVRGLRDQIRRQADALRKEEYRMLLDFYEGGRAPLSDSYVRRHYREEDEAWLARRMNLRGINITRAIPERIRDGLYGRKVERICQDPETHLRLAAIYEENGFDSIACQVALEASILGSHVVGPYFDERLGRVSFRTRYLGDVYPWVSEQNAEVLEALLVEVVIDDLFTGESFLRAEIYTPWETGVFISRDSRPDYWELDRSFHPDGGLTNRYGVIPWVHFRGRCPAQAGDWFGLSDVRDAVEVNKFINELLSIADKNAHDQGWSQLVLINFPDDIERISVGTSKAIRTGEGGDAKYIVPDLKIGEFLDLIDRLYRWAYESAMVPMAAIRTADQPRSGAALEIELKPLVDLIREREKRYRKCEIELMKTTALVDAVHRERRTFTPNEAREFLASLECDVRFTGSLVPEDPNAELERDLKLLAAGLADPVDLVARYHGLSRAEAEKKLEQIRKTSA